MSYTEEYRQAACRLVTQEKYSRQSAAKSLGIPVATLVYWLRRRGPADQPHEKQLDPTAAATQPRATPRPF